MKKVLITIAACAMSLVCFAQSGNSVLTFSRDSALRSTIHRDSMKIEHQYAIKEHQNVFKAHFKQLIKEEKFPVINAGIYSGVLPVQDITEIPDPSLQYKLLFQSTQSNPDSLMNKPDEDLVQIARIINLHVASGIPLKNISIVVVIHGPGLVTICNDAYYQKRFKVDNPNLKLIKELEKIGTRFIACGQAMDLMMLNKSDLLPLVKVSLTAQTALTGYQLKGYVLKTFQGESK